MTPLHLAASEKLHLERNSLAGAKRLAPISPARRKGSANKLLKIESRREGSQCLGEPKRRGKEGSRLVEPLGWLAGEVVEPKNTGRFEPMRKGSEVHLAFPLRSKPGTGNKEGGGVVTFGPEGGSEKMPASLTLIGTEMSARGYRERRRKSEAKFEFEFSPTTA